MVQSGFLRNLLEPDRSQRKCNGLVCPTPFVKALYVFLFGSPIKREHGKSQVQLCWRNLGIRVGEEIYPITHSHPFRRGEVLQDLYQIGHLQNQLAAGLQNPVPALQNLLSSPRKQVLENMHRQNLVNRVLGIV